MPKCSVDGLMKGVYSGIVMLPLASLATGIAIFLTLLWFAVVSIREDERRAAWRASALAILLPIPFLAASWIDFQWETLVSVVLLATMVVVAVVLLVPVGNRFRWDNEAPNRRIDERDTMFSRRTLAKGSERYREYYSRHPDKEVLDDAFRRRPGLLGPGALHYDPITASAADASFATVAAFHALLDDEKLPTRRYNHDPERMTRFIRTWLEKLGVVSSGVAELRDYHLYSTIGRGSRYGEPVELEHSHVVALTVEMDKQLLDRAPRGPTVMESAQQYLNSGAIAVQLAEFIRRLGYSARAHIDGSYRVVCPLVARDAGLGEIGRMGLLMTPELGPRVRIAVVTTDMPLLPSGRHNDPTMIDFCLICRKCAEACPPKAIPFEDMVEIDGLRRWQINSEACFTYWCTVGTDCARCMSVCPYSHPDNLLHNIVRAGIKRSSLARRAALAMDDFFYGRVPEPLDSPAWIANVVESSGRAKVRTSPSDRSQ